MGFTFSRLAIPDVVLVESSVFKDERGVFGEMYKRSQFEAEGIGVVFAQQNYSHSKARVLRGLHFQREPKAQAKLIGVVCGRIYDVAVDIRRGSPTYGRWVSQVLTDDDGRMLYIPEGFAHGFCVLSSEADVIYQVTSEYAPELEGGIVWDDPDLAISWPIQDPVVSKKDRMLPRLYQLTAECVET